jgi:hypothetical protein
MKCIWCGEGTDLSSGLTVCGDIHICDQCISNTIDSELLQDKALVRAMIESPTNEKHYKRIEELISKYPRDENWALYLSSDREPMHEKLEKLVVHWLELNVNNPKLYFRHFLYPAPTPDMLRAAFKWMLKGGRASKRLPPVIADLVAAVATYHAPLRPHVLEFARRWVKSKPNHAYADRVYAAIIAATHSKYDIRKARQWYSTHKQHQRAWHVIAAILEIAYWDNIEPDSYAVQEAKRLLQKEQDRKAMPRLVGGLVSVWPDEQSVAWAKETYERTGLIWILVRLLWRAPDPSLIGSAEKAFDRWINTEHEPEMLYAVLQAEPENKIARARAEWFRQSNPDHEFSPLIAAAIERESADI